MRYLSLACFCCLLLGLAAFARAQSPAYQLPVTVQDRAGKPLVGIWLTLTPPGRIAMTDEKGTAKFINLTPGIYTVSFAPPGYFPLSMPITLTANAECRMNFEIAKNRMSSMRIHSANGDSFSMTLPPVPRPATPPPTEYLLTPPVPAGSGPAWRAAQEVSLREAVFRYLFKTSPPDRHQKLGVYFLSNRGFFPQDSANANDPETSKDPDIMLLSRFRDNKPPVQSVSELTRYNNWRTRYHGHWIIYRVSAFKWTSDTAVQIEAGSFQSGFISTDSLFLDCALRDGWWEINGVTEVSA